MVQYIEYPSGDGKDTEPGHGTHVASSVAGEVFKGWKASDCVEVRLSRWHVHAGANVHVAVYYYMPVVKLSLAFFILLGVLIVQNSIISVD